MALSKAIWVQRCAKALILSILGSILGSVLEAKSIEKNDHFLISFSDGLFYGFWMDCGFVFEGFLS